MYVHVYTSSNAIMPGFMEGSSFDFSKIPSRDRRDLCDLELQGREDDVRET